MSLPVIYLSIEAVLRVQLFSYTKKKMPEIRHLCVNTQATAFLTSSVTSSAVSHATASSASFFMSS